MSTAYQIVVCGSIVPDPLQKLEPVTSPTGLAVSERELSQLAAGGQTTLSGLSKRLGLAPRGKAPEGWRTPGRSAFAGRCVPRVSVLECGGPPPLFPGRFQNCAIIKFVRKIVS